MVKHTPTNRRQIADELFVFVWPFCEISAKRVNNLWLVYIFVQTLSHCWDSGFVRHIQLKVFWWLYSFQFVSYLQFQLSWRTTYHFLLWYALFSKLSQILALSLLHVTCPGLVSSYTPKFSIIGNLMCNGEKITNESLWSLWF